MLDSLSSLISVTALWLVAVKIESQRDSTLKKYLPYPAEVMGLDITAIRFLLDVCRKGSIAALGLAVTGINKMDWSSLAAGAGMVVGLATQDTLSNLVAGFLLMWTRPFRIGERVQIGKCNGWVIGIGMFHTVINSADHERFLIPNAKVFKDQVHNVTTAREADKEIVKKALKKAMDRVHEIQQQGQSLVTGNRQAGLGGRGATLEASPGPVVAIKCVTDYTVKWLMMVYCHSLHKNRVRSMMLDAALDELKLAKVPEIRRMSISSD